MVVTPVPKVTCERSVHDWNAELPIVVTEFGNAISDSLTQLTKAKFPIVVMPSPRVTVLSWLQYWKTLFWIILTVFGIIILDSLIQ